MRSHGRRLAGGRSAWLIVLTACAAFAFGVTAPARAADGPAGTLRADTGYGYAIALRALTGAGCEWDRTTRST